MPKRELSKEFKDRIGHPPTHTSRNIAKKEERIALAREKGRIEGEYKAHDKKPLLLSLREHIGHAFDQMKVTDWIDVIAAIGITPVIRQAVITSESFMKATGASIALIGQIPKEVWAVFLMPLPTDKNYGSDFTGWLLGELKPFIDLGSALGLPARAGPQQGTTAQSTDTTSMLSNILLWLEAFAISWMIVKWGDKMLNAGIGSFAAIGGLLGVSV